MKKKLIIGIAAVLMLLAFALPAQAAAYSSAWYISGNVWYIKGPNGQALQSAWVCDNGAGPGSSNNWYLIDSNGQMVTSPLVQDNLGHYYSLETSHNGNYGMLRYTNGVYDGINLVFNQNHDGSFGCIQNQDGINALMARYGVYNISHISPYNCYYTANYAGLYSGSVQTEKRYTLNFYVNGSKWESASSSSDSIRVRDYGSSLQYWVDRNNGDTYAPGEYYYFSDGRTTAALDAVLSRSVSTTYEIRYYIDGELVYRDYSKSNPMLVVNAGYASLEKWYTPEGNAIFPGQYYSFENGETVTIFYGVLGSSDWADEDDYDDYDDYDDWW